MWTVYVTVGDVEYPHPYVYESDAIYYKADCEAQGYTCRIEEE